MPFYLTIVLHGETSGDTEGIIQGQTGAAELTDRGKEQASTLGDLMAQDNQAFTRIYSSDLRRCFQTANIIVDKLKLKMQVPEVVQTERLRERNYGDWEGLSLTYGPFVDKVKDMKLGPHEIHKIEVPNGECCHEARQRAMRFFKDEILKLADQTPDDETKSVLIVSHRCLFMCFLEELVSSKEEFKLENFDAQKLGTVKVDNTARTRFSVSKPGADGKRTLEFTHLFDTQHFSYLTDNLTPSEGSGVDPQDLSAVNTWRSFMKNFHGHHPTWYGPLPRIVSGTNFEPVEILPLLRD